MPRISIIIPIYNTNEDLLQCLDTIREQTFRDYEVILIDDGSTNGAEKVCDEYAGKDPRFRVYHYENAGVATARNRGMAQATGEWVTFVDSDDWLDNHYLQGMVDCAAENPDAQIIINTTVRINDEKNISWNRFDQEQLKENSAFNSEIVIKYMPSSMWCYMIKREYLDGVQVDPKLHFYEDLDFVLQVFKQARVCGINDRGGYHYRQGSVTHRKLTWKTLTAFDVVDKQIKSGLDAHVCRYLEQLVIMSVAFVGAEDPQYDPQLNKTLQKRAALFCKDKHFQKPPRRVALYMRMISCTPRLFYGMQRIKNRGKKLLHKTAE